MVVNAVSLTNSRIIFVLRIKSVEIGRNVEEIVIVTAVSP